MRRVMNTTGDVPELTAGPFEESVSKSSLEPLMSVAYSQGPLLIKLQRQHRRTPAGIRARLLPRHNVTLFPLPLLPFVPAAAHL